MKRRIELPSSVEFCESIQYAIRKYEIIDCMYRKCVEEFNQIKLVDLKEAYKYRILVAFLLNWG